MSCLLSSKGNYFLLFSFLLILASCQNNAPKIDMDLEVPNFGLHDHNGDFHTLYYYGDSKAVVLFTQSNACSVVRNDVNDLKEVRKAFKDKGVEFFMINSNKQERVAIAEEAEEYDFDMSVLIDENQLVAEALQLHKSGEILVLDPDNWSVAYRGPVQNGDENYVNAALEALFKGEYLAENYKASKGTSFDLMHPNPAKFASISYEKEIAPMLAEKCMKCHVEGGIAPFAMKDYETVLGWSDMIREVVRTNRMPPWQADPHYGEFENDLSLSNEELQKLVHWIDAGAKRTEGEADPLTTYHVKKDKWELGEPDILVQLNKEEIPAKGIIDYRYQKIDIELKEDVWATAIQVMPDNKEVIHHMIVSVIYPDGFVEPIDRRSPWLDGLLMAWAPGQSIEIFPENTGRILPKGSKLHFQLHYTSNGKAQFDESSIGIYTTNKAPEDEYLMAGAFNPEIVMEPNDPNYENRAKYKFREETTLYSVSPHMHFRGKAMKFIALYPDGTKEILLNVPNYNFNWQRSYRFTEPKILPARTVVYVDAVFDNSARNSFNPGPDKTVYWGDYSFDEMLVGYMSFQYGRKGVPDSGPLSMK